MPNEATGRRKKLSPKPIVNLPKTDRRLSPPIVVRLPPVSSSATVAPSSPSPRSSRYRPGPPEPSSFATRRRGRRNAVAGITTSATMTPATAPSPSGPPTPNMAGSATAMDSDTDDLSETPPLISVGGAPGTDTSPSDPPPMHAVDRATATNPRVSGYSIPSCAELGILPQSWWPCQTDSVATAGRPGGDGEAERVRRQAAASSALSYDRLFGALPARVHGKRLGADTVDHDKATLPPPPSLGPEMAGRPEEEAPEEEGKPGPQQQQGLRSGKERRLLPTPVNGEALGYVAQLRQRQQQWEAEAFEQQQRANWDQRKRDRREQQKRVADWLADWQRREREWHQRRQQQRRREQQQQQQQRQQKQREREQQQRQREQERQQQREQEQRVADLEAEKQMLEQLMRRLTDAL